MKRAVLVALMTVLVPATSSAQEEDTYSLRWTVAGGPSLATPSGNKLTLTGVRGCNTCGRALQKVFGADESKYNATLNIAGDLPLDLTLRGELMFNHSVSDIQKPPPRQCIAFKCTQLRKAMKDDAWFLGGGLEFAPTKSLIKSALLNKFPIVPYVAVTGGVTMNRVWWTWDTTGTSTKQEGYARAFGTYAAGGLGVRLEVKNVTVFAESRRFQNFSTPGTALASFSFGLQYWLRLRNYGY